MSVPLPNSCPLMVGKETLKSWVGSGAEDLTIVPQFYDLLLVTFLIAATKHPSKVTYRRKAYFGF